MSWALSSTPFSWWQRHRELKKTSKISPWVKGQSGLQPCASPPLHYLSWRVCWCRGCAAERNSPGRTGSGGPCIARSHSTSSKRYGLITNSEIITTGTSHPKHELLVVSCFMNLKDLLHSIINFCFLLPVVKTAESLAPHAGSGCSM